MYLLNILGETRSEPVEDRWFRQAQPTRPRFFEKVPNHGENISTARARQAGDKVLVIGKGYTRLSRPYDSIANLKLLQSRFPNAVNFGTTEEWR